MLQHSSACYMVLPAHATGTCSLQLVMGSYLLSCPVYHNWIPCRMQPEHLLHLDSDVHLTCRLYCRDIYSRRGLSTCCGIFTVQSLCSKLTRAHFSHHLRTLESGILSWFTFMGGELEFMPKLAASLSLVATQSCDSVVPCFKAWELFVFSAVLVKYIFIFFYVHPNDRDA